MARLRHKNGAVVEVSDEMAERLLARDFTAEETKKSTRRKAASSDESEK